MNQTKKVRLMIGIFSEALAKQAVDWSKLDILVSEGLLSEEISYSLNFFNFLEELINERILLITKQNYKSAPKNLNREWSIVKSYFGIIADGKLCTSYASENELFYLILLK